MFAGVQNALDAAATTYPGNDTVYIGEGTFTSGGSGYDYSSPDEVNIIGAGQSETILKSPAVNGTTTLSVGTSLLNDVESLRIDMPEAANATGLDLKGEARSVSVLGLSPATTTGRAIRLLGATISAVEKASVAAVGSGVTAIEVSTTAPVVIQDSLVRSGFVSISGSNNGPLAIHRSTLEADVTAISQANLDNGTGTTVDNSMLRLTDPNAGNKRALLTVGEGAIQADQLTVIGPGSGEGAVASGATNGLQATVELDNSIFTGFTVDLAAHCSGGGTSSLTVTYSRFTSSAQDPACAVVAEGAGNTSQPPGFVLPGITNPTLRWDSPLIDAGRPGASPFALDLAGEERLRDGDGVGGARRDMGAREYQRRAPTVIATATPQVADPGVPFHFGAKIGDEAGDGPLPVWAFDDGATATTGSVDHAFETPGPHTATLTATDPTGLSASDSVTVTVNQPPAGTEPPTTSPDDDPPETTIRKRKHRATADRTPTFRFSSDEPGSTFRCKVDKRKYHPCGSPLTTKRQTFDRHKLRVFAIDAAGNADPTPAKRRFRVVDR